MAESIWTNTLGAFRDRLATVESVPAGVSTAAVTAAFALSLLIKVVKIASRRKAFAGDGSLALALMDDARIASELLSHCADEDIVAFRERSRGAIEVPLKVARAAVSGLVLCGKAEALVHKAVAPDLEAAATLLASAVRATLFSLEANLEQLPAGDSYGENAAAEARQLLQQCEAARLPWTRFRADR